MATKVNREKNLLRFLKIDRSKIDVPNRTVEMVASTESPVERWGEQEVLSHDKADVNLTRLSAGNHPLLAGHDEHDLGANVGVIERAWLDDQKQLRCLARFSKRAKADEIFQDVCDGILGNVSIGYDRDSIIESTKAADGMVTTRYRWTPYHVGIVNVPADTKASILRHKKRNEGETTEDDNICLICGTENESGATECSNCKSELPERSHAKIDSTVKVNVQRISELLTAEEKENMKRLLFAPDSPAGGAGTMTPDQARVDERKRIADIEKTAAELLEKAKDRPDAEAKVRELVSSARADGMSLGDFQMMAMREIIGAKPAEVRTMVTEGMDPSKYSLLRAIQTAMDNKGIPTGYEGEIHQHFASRARDRKPSGFIVPIDAPGYVQPSRRSRRMRSVEEFRKGRDLQVNVFGQGGATVAMEMYPLIEILRNRMKCFDFGVQVMAGLEGNCALPRQTAAATAYSVPEIGALTISTQVLDQIALAPKRVGAYNQYSKQLLLQSSIDVENFVRDDLMKVLAIDIDRIILNGQGGNSEPMGIMNTPGIGSIVFGGSASWANIVLMETTVASQNADIGEMGYMTTPSSKGRLKSIAKLLIGATTVAAVPLWDGMLGDGSADGEMNGYRAGSTLQVPNNQLLFGVFSQAVLAMWGGYDVVVNPYSLDTQAEVRITVNAFIDVAVRHPQSFCVSADAANQ